MDYFKIGQRIRCIRKARGFSQEMLAEQAGISATHMSHIETGNTKLSLPVLIAMAEALEVSTDTLLYDVPRGTVTNAMGKVKAVMESCDARQAAAIAEIVKSIKQAMDVYGMEPGEKQ